MSFEAKMALLLALVFFGGWLWGYLQGTLECRAWMLDRPPVCPPPDWVARVEFNNETYLSRGWINPSVAQHCAGVLS